MWTLICLVISSVLVSAADPGWERLQRLKTGEAVTVRLSGGEVVQGQFDGWSPDSLRVSVAAGQRSIKAADVEQVRARRGIPRWKAALVGTGVGFGIAFPIGAASAGYLTDRNNPSFAVRAGTGAGLGLFGGGIGAAVGALAGGRKNVTVYRARPAVPDTFRR